VSTLTILAAGIAACLLVLIIRAVAGREGDAAQTREPTYRERLIEWRSSWGPDLEGAGWIAKGAIAKVVKEKPPPSAPSNIDTTVHSIPRDIEDAIETEFKAHNKLFRKAQRERLKGFFDTVEKNPLTDEQIEACICMDDNVQIVAAAGSGKTSTMVAKAGYALHEGLVKPSEILMLAFNKDAAQELRDRVDSRLSGFAGIEDVTAKTFNSFGLSVIGEATGRKPTIPKWVVDPGEDLRMISTIIDNLSDRSMTFALKWALYRTVYARDIGSAGAAEKPDAYKKGRFGFRAASGHLVKSLEELVIANWLYLNQVEFEYERRYEHDTVNSRHAQYRPDFYYPQISLYHEHFALDEQGRAPPHFANYVDGVTWKRALHAEKGTKLFETQSHQMRNGAGLRALKTELRRRGVVLQPDGNRESKVPPLIDNQGMAKLIRTFQQHVKSNGLDRDQLRTATRRHASIGYGPRVNLFLSIYEDVSREWEERLRAEEGVDFEDMLVMAARLIEDGQYSSPYTMVLADEFQDSSRSRVRLLKALAGAAEDVHLCVVGDDWQGINRFAGADISVMTEFERHFANSTRLALGTTFRCPQELCDASSQFVQANPAQIRKTVRTTNRRKGNVLVAFGFQEKESAPRHLEKRLSRLHQAQQGEASDAGKLRVLILGRYRKDEPASLRLWQRRFGSALDIDFRTVHRSKGLEADYVVILSIVEQDEGRSFPSSMEDDPLLQIPMPDPDPYPFAEERRLFYVALTRARRQVWIYTELAQPSRFLRELQDNGRLHIKPMDGEPPEHCPKCQVGSVRVREGQYGLFEACTSFPQCDLRRSLKQDVPGETKAQTGQATTSPSVTSAQPADGQIVFLAPSERRYDKPINANW